MMKTLTVQSVTDMVYGSEDQSKIYCTVKFAEMESSVPYCAGKDDPVSSALFSAIDNGDYGYVGPFATPPVVEAPALSIDQQMDVLAVKAGFRSFVEAATYLLMNKVRHPKYTAAQELLLKRDELIDESDEKED
jgi:hypothetical protein